MHGIIIVAVKTSPLMEYFHGFMAAVKLADFLIFTRTFCHVAYNFTLATNVLVS